MSERPTIADVKNMTQEEKDVLTRKASIQIAKHIAIKIGTVLAVQLAASYLLRRIDDGSDDSDD